jgi:transposase
VIQKEECMEIRILRRQGKSLRAIAKEIGLSINTVRKYLAQEEGPKYKTRMPRLSKLDAYKEYLVRRLESAAPATLPAPVLFREIKDLGFQGKVTILRDYLQSIKPKGVEDPLVRFETGPGVQMQVDWVEFKKESLSAFVATLGFSRASYVEYVENERIETLIACHIKALEYFGGVPQEILYDNMKTVVLKRDAQGPGQHQFHPTLWDVAKHYGFKPRLCQPYRAKTKGKVERFNRYLRHSFHVPLLTQLKMEGLSIDMGLANFKVWQWLKDVAHQRVVRGVGQKPADRLILERAHLMALPPTYLGAVRGSRPHDSEAGALPKKKEMALPKQHPLSTYDRLLEVA